MPARVIFDTGSEHLAVTSSLCNNHTAGKYHFTQAQYSKNIVLEQDHEEEKPKETNTTESVAETNKTKEDTKDWLDDDYVQMGDIYNSEGKKLDTKLDKKRKDPFAPVK